MARANSAWSRRGWRFLFIRTPFAARLRRSGLGTLVDYNTMKKQLTYITPLRTGIVLGILYGLLGLVIVPFFVLGAVFGTHHATGGSALFGMLGLLFPVLYAVAGFIGGIIAAAIYNLVAKWTGGLEFEVRDVPSAA
jgi:hypothetical protein